MVKRSFKGRVAQRVIPDKLKLWIPRYRKGRIMRCWSNDELKKFAHLMGGDVVNVSGWKDIDKQGKHYVDYFTKAKSYTITNFDADFKGFQGYEGEIFLDLAKKLPKKLERAFDVVFNHTTLEHIYEVKRAFKNLCLMSRNIVIIVVPFHMNEHDKVDYWRMTPTCIRTQFKNNGFGVVYMSQSHHRFAVKHSYIFVIGQKYNQPQTNVRGIP